MFADTRLESSSGRRARPGRARAARSSSSRGLGACRLLDKRVDAGIDDARRLRDARQVAAANEKMRRGRRGSARRRSEQAILIMSKSKSSAAPVLRAIDHPDRGVDADRAHVLHERRVRRARTRVIDQEFERQRLAVGVRRRRAPRASSRPRRAARGRAEQLAVAARAVARRLHAGLAESLSGILPRNGSRSASSSGRGLRSP